MEEFFERKCCIGGYHVYEEVWEAAVGESLCEREAQKCFRSIRCGCEKGTIIRHLPRKVSWVCSLFLPRRGTIECTVTGRRKYSADLAQGGLEVPCSAFQGNTYGTHRFRESVAWPKVVSDRHY